MGDMNAKVGREIEAFAGAIGPHSLHTDSNDNGTRLASLAIQNNLVIGGTLFPHKDVHKGTWDSPDGHTVNQIDHIMVRQKFRTALFDTRTFRGADCDSDHRMVVGRIKVKLKSKRTPTQRTSKINVEKLEDANIRREYATQITNRFSVLDDEADIGLAWEEMKNIVTEVGTEVLGTIRKARRNDWFDQECEAAARRRNGNSHKTH